MMQNMPQNCISMMHDKMRSQSGTGSGMMGGGAQVLRMKPVDFDMLY